MQEEKDSRCHLQIYMRLGKKAYCLFDTFKESLCLNMDEEAQLYIRKGITSSQPP